MKFTGGFLAGSISTGLFYGVGALGWPPALLLLAIIAAGLGLLAMGIEFIEHWE